MLQRAFRCSTCAVFSLALAAQCSFDKELSEAASDLRSGQFSQAAAILERVESAAPHCDPDQYRMLAVAWLQLRSSEKALAAAESGIAAFPASATLQDYYLSLLPATVPKDKTAAYLERALAMSPHSGRFRKALGKALFDRNPESDRAGSLLAGAVQGMPLDVEAHSFYAEWLCAAHREHEALGHLNRALSLSAGDPEVQVSVYRLQALAEDRLNRLDDAGESYRKAIGLNRKLAKPAIYAEWEYAGFLMRHGEDATARTVLESLLAMAPSFAPARFGLARVLEHLRQYDQSIQQARVALGDSGNEDEQKRIHIFLSRVCHTAGREEEARDHEQWVENH